MGYLQSAGVFSLSIEQLKKIDKDLENKALTFYYQETEHPSVVVYFEDEEELDKSYESLNKGLVENSIRNTFES